VPRVVIEHSTIVPFQG